MTDEIFTRDNGIKIRRFKSGRCVREDEWRGFVKLNEPLHLSYMIKNEPFEKLPLSYKPVQKLDHYPPRLSFGFAIPKELAQFRQAALENNLGDPEELRTTNSFFFHLQTLVMSFLNGRCGLSPEADVDCNHARSLEAALVLELKSNYRRRVPKEKMNGVIRAIKETFQLPDDTKPKWYLDGGIDLGDPDGYLLPMSLVEWSECPESWE